jgi:hypothetical protein
MRIGIATDHGGFSLQEELLSLRPLWGMRSSIAALIA